MRLLIIILFFTLVHYISVITLSEQRDFRNQTYCLNVQAYYYTDGAHGWPNFLQKNCGDYLK